MKIWEISKISKNIKGMNKIGNCQRLTDKIVKQCLFYVKESGKIFKYKTHDPLFWENIK